MARKQLPRFANEADEVAFYESHQEDVLDYFEPVTAENDPGLGFEPAARPRTRSITLRMAVPDLDRIKALAARKGLGYQTLLKMALHEWLEREERRAI